MSRRLPVMLWRAGLIGLVWLALAMFQAAHAGAEGPHQAREGAVVNVVVELDAAPVIQVYLAQQANEVSAAALTTATQAHLAEVETQQRALLQALESQGVGFDVLYRNQRVYNGVALAVEEARLSQIAALPEVVAVHPLTLKAPATNISVPHIHAPQLWAGADAQAGLTGEGVRIAIIDTGIDYLHTAFGGPGFGYEQNYPNVIGDAPNFPGVKIIGGWDFAGDDYNADPEAPSYSPVPMPNPDPMDCYAPGHGTHVAAIAAGYGVQASGATYRGPYNAALNPADFRVGPGVAPQAQIYALKVFGCRGKTALVDAAIEWAVDPNRDGDFSDRADIINLSLGSGYGAAYDSTAIAADNAARLGIVVVSSAGNNGDTVYAVGSPGVGEAVISVAATRLEVAACSSAPCPRVDLMADFSARGPRRVDALLKPDLAAPGFAIHAARAWTGSEAVTLSGTSMAAPHVAGAAALLLQAMQAEMAGSDEAATNAPGARLWQPGDVKARLMNTARNQVQIAVDKPEPGYAPVRIGAGPIDLTAALAAQAVAYSAESPHAVSVSFGAPAVVDTLHQTRNVQLANRGPHPITFTVSYSPALTTPGVAIAGPEPDADAGDVYTLTLAPYGAVTVPVTLSAHAASMRYARDPTLAAVDEWPRHWLAESGGYLIFTPQNGPQGGTDPPHPALHVPVYAAPQPAAHLQAMPPALDFGKAITTTRTITLVGQGLTGDASPLSPVSLATVLELHRVSSRQNSFAGMPPAVFAHADLQYVGAGRAALGKDGEEEALLYFGVAVHGSWSTLNEVEFNVWLDTNNDNRADYRLYNSDLDGYRARSWSDSRGSDVFVAALENLGTGARGVVDFINGASAATYTGNVYNTNILILPLPLHLIDWDAEAGVLNYRVSAYSRSFGNHPVRSPVVDATPWLTMQVTPPALGLRTDPTLAAPAAPLFVAESGSQVRVDYVVSHYVATAPSALMVFHFHNLPSRRVEILPIAYQLPFEQFLPTINRNSPVPGILPGAGPGE